MTSRARTYNSITYVDPNELFGGDNIGVNQEELTKYVNLSVKIPSRYYNNNVKTYDSLLGGTDFSFPREVEGENGERKTDYINIPLLSTNYTDISFNDINSGNLYNSEVFGIKSINISFDSQLFPRVDMVFTDVRGFGLMSSNEIVNRTDNTNVKTFFTSLFNFPYPIFTLTVKGYYGGTVSFNLSLLTFDTNFESETGNFNVNISFIGDMYGVLTDIPMSYLLIAPYLGSGNETNSYWNSINDSNKLPTFFELINNYSNFLNGELGDNVNENVIAGYIQLIAKISYLNELKRYYDEIYQLALKSKKIHEQLLNENRLWKNEDGRTVVLIDYYNSNYTYLFIYETPENYNTTKGIITDIVEGKIKKLTIKGASHFNYDNYNKIDIKHALFNNNEDDAYVKDEVIAIEQFDYCRNNVENDLNELTSSFNGNNYVNMVNELLTQVLGISPSIKNIYDMAIKHLDVFMNYFYDKIKNINYQNIVLENYITTDSTNSNKLPPFCSFYNTNEKKFFLPQNLYLMEEDIVNDIIKTTRGSYSDFETVKEEIESQRVTRENGSLISNFICDNYFVNDETYTYRSLNKIDRSEVIERLYKIFINRAKGYIKFYGTDNINTFIDNEINTILNTNAFNEERIREILNNVNLYDAYVNDIINEETINLNYGGDEIKYAICRQNNNNFLGSFFILNFGQNNELKAPFDFSRYYLKNAAETTYYEGQKCNTTKYNGPVLVDINSAALSTNFDVINPTILDNINEENTKIQFPATSVVAKEDYSCLLRKEKDYYYFYDGFLSALVDEYDLFKPKTNNNHNPILSYYYNQKNKTNTYNIYKYQIGQLCALGEALIINDEYSSNGASIPYKPVYNYYKQADGLKFYTNIKMSNAAKELYYNILYLTQFGRTDYFSNKKYNLDEKYENLITDEDKTKFKEEYNVNKVHPLLILCNKYLKTNLTEFLTFDDDISYILRDYYFLLMINLQKYECTNTNLKNVLHEFHRKFSERTNVSTTITTLSTAEESNTYEDELKVSVYYNLKNLYDKWLCSLNYDFFKYGGDLTNNIHCISPLHEDISDSVCDIDKLYKEIDGIVSNEKRGVSVINFLSNIAQQNNMLFLTQPSNTVENFEDFFKPVSIPRIIEEPFPQLYFISQGQVSHNLNIPNSEFNDDGIYYFNTETNEFNTQIFNTFDLSNINVFGVSYGIQNQNFFKRVNINTITPMETEDSIANLFDISNKGSNESTSKGFINSSSLYPIYSKRSYTCTVEMMGCMNIMPLTYFQLNNIPLFNGAYMIIDVKHSITPNDFSTTVTGVRVSKYKIPIDSKVFNLPSFSILSDKYMNTEVNQEEFIKDTSETTTQLTPPTTIDTNEVNIDQYGKHWKAFNSSEGAMAKNTTVPDGREGYDDCWRTGIGIILSHSGVTPNYEYNVSSSFTWDNNSHYVGDRNNIIKLLYEKDSNLYYDESGDDAISDGFTSKIESKYAQAISCIEHHIDNKCPIMVGVNHTIGKGKNEGTTDHFVVIYAYGNFGDGKKYYRYYETGSNNTKNGFTGTAERVNYFIYDTNNGNPLLYNPNTYRTSNTRYDVTQVRPYISSKDNSNWLYIVSQGDTPSGDTILEK